MLYSLAIQINELKISKDEKRTKLKVSRIQQIFDRLQEVDRAMNLPGVDFDKKDAFMAFLRVISARHKAISRLNSKVKHVVDGVLSVGEYDSEPLADNFYSLKSCNSAQCQTRVWGQHDGKNLYLAFECFQPQMNDIIVNAKNQDAEVWKDESVEVFLYPNPDDKITNFHVIVNAAGILFDEKIKNIASDAQGTERYVGWDSHATIKTIRLKDRWIAEIVIPTSSMGTSEFLSSGRKWSMNICRNAMTKSECEWSSWVPVFSSTFHSSVNTRYVQVQ